MCAPNPLGYKFSWSSRGVLLALLNDAKWIEGGKVTEVNGKELMGCAKKIFIKEGYAFVGYPNRRVISLISANWAFPFLVSPLVLTVNFM
jgi:saccharopine dehydrogenase-like NADP-dependent oxidoreductase